MQYKKRIQFVSLLVLSLLFSYSHSIDFSEISSKVSKAIKDEVSGALKKMDDVDYERTYETLKVGIKGFFIHEELQETLGMCKTKVVGILDNLLSHMPSLLSPEQTEALGLSEILSTISAHTPNGQKRVE